MLSLCRQTDRRTNGKTICPRSFNFGALKKKGKKFAKIQVEVTEFGPIVGMMVQKACAKFQSNILSSYRDYDGGAPETLTPLRTLFVGHFRFLLIIWYQVVCID